MTISIPLVKSLEAVPGYAQFHHDLETTINLHTLSPDQLKWVAMQPGTMLELYPPKCVIDIGTESPQLAVNLHPTLNGHPVTGNLTYQAPLLLRDVGRWKGNDLRDYKVSKWRGVPNEKMLFTKKPSYPLHEFLDGLVQGLEESTPVVEIVAFLPMSPDGSYVTEFTPEISFGLLGHGHYIVSTVAQDGMNALRLLTQGRSVEVQDVDKDKQLYLWKAEMLADLSDMEALMVPSTAGHMILIAQPIEAPEASFRIRDDDSGINFRGGSFGGLPTRSLGASIGDVSLSQGSRTGQASSYTGDLTASRKGRTTIYHIKYFGVRPEHAQSLTREQLQRAANTLDTFVKQ